MKRAVVRTTHSDAPSIANAVRPDNTDAIDTTVTNQTVETTIERPTTGGLLATLDDYVVNLHIASTMLTDTENETMTTHDNGTIQQ